MTDVDLLVLGTIVTARADGQVIGDGGVAVSNGAILEVGGRSDIESRFTAQRIVDSAGMLVFPGLVDTHTHLYQTLLKGLGDDLPLMEWRDGKRLEPGSPVYNQQLSGREAKERLASMS